MPWAGAMLVSCTFGAATRISFGLGLDHVGGKSRESIIQSQAAYITLTLAWMASGDLYVILIQRQAPYNKINHQPTFTRINSQRDVVELDKANRTQQNDFIKTSGCCRIWGV